MMSVTPKPIAFPLIFGLIWSNSALSQDITKFNTIETHAPATIDAIKISNQNFAFREIALQKFGGLRLPIISFNISNKGRVTIKEVYMRALLKAPGRAVAFAENTVDYAIPGGLAPGESKHVALDADTIGDWNSVTQDDARKASFSLTVTAVEDADGNRLVK
jgi:hypothetical protein